MEEKRIVITGTGAVTPLGTGTEAFWEECYCYCAPGGIHPTAEATGVPPLYL